MVLIGKRKGFTQGFGYNEEGKERNLWYGLYEYEQYHKKEKKKGENKDRENKQ